ncbi:hypothetical protein [Yersinia kristensenii]|uniref:putative zinc ribbon protein n=1 Tax=Yersinia kristensenii TaxID=28152 RepID=UPI001C6105F3|nr:hypothetical protein [Yersinia kristensenii]MBW5811517.1 hypothetical protein [Yersinia kristensenii]MBW5828779.1 hypothetical protein [Yersinia kristensenii]
MYEPVYAPCAITYHGEWVVAETVLQEDYDILFCECCRLKIGVSIDPLTGVKTFVHMPGSVDDSKRLIACRYSNTPGKSLAGGMITQQTPVGRFGYLRPVKPRQLPCETTMLHWRCQWCSALWYGDKMCPVCHDWIYALPVGQENVFDGVG